jgi:DNA-binding NarL/FixJ family response regulator
MMTQAENGFERGRRPHEKNNENKQIRILVVDDHPVVRFGLIGQLRAQSDFIVVGEASNCEECCQNLQSYAPDVVLLDLELDDASGLDALIKLRSFDPDMPTIVYTAHGADWRVVEAIKIGVQGYLMKKAPIDSVFQAIRVVHQGGSYLDPAVTSKVMGAVGRRSGKEGDKFRSLSERETTVLQMLAQGKRNKDISRALSITERTVKFHISSLLAKLDAGNRTEAVVVAAELGLIHF